MFKSKTVFVVGAGASMEFGFPSGEALKEQILKIVNERQGLDNPFTSFLQTLYSNLTYEKISEIQKIFNNALPHHLTIDNFLNSNQTNKNIVKIGKFLICHVILKNEQHCHLFKGRYVKNDRYVENNFKYRDLNKNNWLDSFVKFINEGTVKENINNLFQNITFITFNYDRNIEQYIYNSLIDTYSLTLEEAKIIFSKLEIIHVYGSVGDYLEQIDLHNHVNSDYGSIHKAIQSAKNIKIFYEQTESEAAPKIKTYIHEADNLVFLGFSFALQNMSLLHEENSMRKKPLNIFGTALGLSEDACYNIEKYLYKNFENSDPFSKMPTKVTLNKITSYELLQQYQRSISS